MKYHCFFEQSGTFKNEFKKLGFKSYDYDILNQFNETDYIIDLYKEIDKAYNEEKSIFDSFKSDEDTILAFFPCIRFEAQILLAFRGDASQDKKKSDIEKLRQNLRLHKELSNNYELITKIVMICIRKKIPLIIENPYSEQHYLRRYWSLKPSIIDMNRTKKGDYFKKPTQYWFINRKPSTNFIFEPLNYTKTKRIDDCSTVERSMISPQYANRFIREYILDSDKEN